jgi:hypothetical protein
MYLGGKVTALKTGAQMLFFFRKPKVTVDCFIDSKIMADTYSIRRATKLTPIWWQDLTPTCPVSISGITEQAPTSKQCSGFLSLYKESWMVPLWSDLIVHTASNGQYKYKFASNETWATMHTHPSYQYQGGFTDKIHFKINCPWHLAENRKTKFLFLPATWSLADSHAQLHFLPGILDFTSNHAIHANALAPKAEQQYRFFAGSPLIHLVPLTEHEVKFKTHAVTEQEFKQLQKDTHPRNLNKFL